MTQTTELDPQKILRNTLGHFPTGVCLVTALVDGERLGMTMTSFNSLSLTPPLVLFSIDKRSRSLVLWERAEGYAIHVLSDAQQDTSNRFARPGDKWADIAHETGLHGAPILADTLAVFECAAHRIVDAGDHKLFIAEVKAHRADDTRAPLVFARGRYAQLAAH